MEQAQAVTGWFGQPGTQPGMEQSSGVGLRHLRYFVALADAGTFTEAYVRRERGTLDKRSVGGVDREVRTDRRGSFGQQPHAR